MASGAMSWEIKTPSPDRVVSALAHALTQVRSPSGAVVFVSGSLVKALDEVLDKIASLRAGIAVAVGAGSGVLTERGEIEDQAAASGIVWSGGRSELVELSPGDENDVGPALARLLSDRTGKTAPTVITLLRPDSFGPSTLAPLDEFRGTRNVIGAGTVGDPGAVGVDASGQKVRGSVAMILRGIAQPAIRTTHSVRLLAPLRPITACRGAMLLEVDGEPALDVLAAQGERLSERPLLFAVLADEPSSGPSEGGRPALVVRGIQGVDPDRRALVISEEIREGMRVTFGIRDARAARDDMEAITRELERDIAGAAPRFGLYINCAGRGSSLYGAHDVDSKILKARFPGLPFAGMASSFEIAPRLGRPTLQLYSGVFALFTSPS
jgi:small ligand-binding sensory domain FIST